MTVHRASNLGLSRKPLLVYLLIPAVLAVGLATHTTNARADSNGFGPVYVTLTGSPADDFAYSSDVYLSGGCYYFDSYLASTFDEEYSYLSWPSCTQISAGWHTWRQEVYKYSGNSYVQLTEIVGVYELGGTPTLLSGQYRWTASYWT